MTHKLVTAILLAELVLLAGPARAERIKYVEVVIVTKPADIDAIRNEALKATVDAREAVQRAEEQLWRAKLSRRPDRDIQIDRAERAKKWAEDHQQKLKVQTAVEGLYQAAIHARVARKSLAELQSGKDGNDPPDELSPAAAPVKHENAKRGDDPRDESSPPAEARRARTTGLARRDGLLRRDASEQAWRRVSSAHATIESACKQLSEITSLERGKIAPTGLVEELHEYVDPFQKALHTLKESLRELIDSGREEIGPCLIEKAQEAEHGARLVEEYLNKLSDPMPRSEPHFRIEILYGNRICGRAGFRDQVRTDKLKNGEKMYVFLIDLDPEGILESTSDKAKLRITKSYNREPPEIAWGIWDIKDVWAAGYFAPRDEPKTESQGAAGNGSQTTPKDEEEESGEEEGAGSEKSEESRGAPLDEESLRDKLRQLRQLRRLRKLRKLREGGTRVDLLPLTVVDNYDASVLFAVETEELHGFRPGTASAERTTVSSGHPDYLVDPERDSKEDSKPLRIHRIVYEWPFQNAAD